MSWTVPQYSHNQVNKAGERIVGLVVPEEEMFQAMGIINNWRSAHAYPLQVIKMTLKNRAKSVDASSVVAQRIKRIPAIRLKLQMNPRMTLSSMHDIGGCRAVMKSVSMVERLVEKYELSTAKNPRRGGCFVRKYDYITNPRESGYRGVHLVYKFVTDSQGLHVFNGLRIEIQIRSRLQHSWATAVETVSFFTGQALKSNLGEQNWRRFFAIVAALFAGLEKRPTVPNINVDEKDLFLELLKFKKCIDQLGAFTLAAAEMDSTSGYFHLLVLDPSARTVSVKSFEKQQAAEAQNAYLEAEKQIAISDASVGLPKQAVLVSVDSYKNLRKAYPNYFLDISGFFDTLTNILNSAQKQIKKQIAARSAPTH